MCGIFGLIEQNNHSTEISAKIKDAFMSGSNRGPEFSHIERYRANTANNTTIHPISNPSLSLKCPNCEYIIDTPQQKVSLILGFHRLAINGLSSLSNQPFEMDSCVLVCNGEIYNYKRLARENNITLLTESDCEIIIHMYRLYGIEYTLNMLDGVFAFILYDTASGSVYVARDPYGVRPLYMKTSTNPIDAYKTIGFASEMKSLYSLYSDNIQEIRNIEHFPPAHYAIINMGGNKPSPTFYKYSDFPCRQLSYLALGFDEYTIINDSYHNGKDNGKDTGKDTGKFAILNRMIYNYVNNAVKKRVVGTTERPIACLLSGGLDSSIICALVNRHYNSINSIKSIKSINSINSEDNTNVPRKLQTYSIGLPGSIDLKYARMVANHLDTEHHEIEISEDDFFNAIPEVIKTIESYDTTTVRASVGNYLVAKYIKEHSDAKVIFNGDGADELMGGYLYMSKAPTPMEFDRESRRLLRDIHMFDVLRSDKCVSSHGLEPRTPFLDRKWVEFYLSISREMRCHGLRLDKDERCEKFLIRNAFSNIDPELLPREVLWRTKEAFSDGVSSYERSWYVIIDEKIKSLYYNNPDLRGALDSYIEDISAYPQHNQPITLEQRYYRYLYDRDYRGTERLIPYFWLPKYVEASDASARTLTGLYRVES